MIQRRVKSSTVKAFEKEEHEEDGEEENGEELGEPETMLDVAFCCLSVGPGGSETSGDPGKGG